MSERSFFDLRYAVPGFTFLLFLVLILRVEFLSFLRLFTTPDTSLVGFSLGLLTLMSGSVIGFLISQIWYAYYNCCYKKKYLKESFKILDGLGVKEDLTTVIDYIVHTLDGRDKGLKDYI